MCGGNRLIQFTKRGLIEMYRRIQKSSMKSLFLSFVEWDCCSLQVVISQINMFFCSVTLQLIKKISFDRAVLFQYIFLGLGKHCPLLGASKNVPQIKNVKINTRFSLSVTEHTIGLSEESLAGEQSWTELSRCKNIMKELQGYFPNKITAPSL